MSESQLTFDLDDEEDLSQEGYDQLIRAKWAFDGATTLSEAAEMLRSYADWLEEKESLGWRLTAPIEDDYGYLKLYREDGSIIEGAEL